MVSFGVESWCRWPGRWHSPARHPPHRHHHHHHHHLRHPWAPLRLQGDPLLLWTTQRHFRHIYISASMATQLSFENAHDLHDCCVHVFVLWVLHLKNVLGMLLAQSHACFSRAWIYCAGHSARAITACHSSKTTVKNSSSRWRRWAVVYTCWGSGCCAFLAFTLPLGWHRSQWLSAFRLLLHTVNAELISCFQGHVVAEYWQRNGVVKSELLLLQIIEAWEDLCRANSRWTMPSL